MPFFRPFREKFFAGDLVYGLSEQRNIYFSKISHFNGVKTYYDEKRSPPILIDYYLTPVELKNIDEIENILKHGPLSDSDNQYYNEVVEDFQERYNYNKCDHYTYKKYEADFFKYLRHNKKYCNVMDGKQEYNELTIGRKCKGGLSWIGRSNSKLVRDIHVHFILDGIDMERVAEKREDEKSITGKELRWLFRHRYHLKVMKKVQFWNNGNPTFPPWMGSGSYVWNNYARHLTEKENLGLDEEIYDGLSRLFKIL
ncbi:hypothetical protein ID858_11205 [Xenorhabdus sp. DI]|uniref:hypothetical protein n=1 Tax=Xenorhabdus doucetiae TaxID=351671 RepID=UPI0019A5B214|nr:MULTISPECIES: hypothetical protein [unclassified Xenorhabdus]MBD2783450.1 hypothetical protein [Xenorhabdus sp. 3]MBD2789073.1 hypothetical protein [Xenorhabdus sp. DI]